MTTRVTLIGDNAVNSGSIFNGTVNSEDLNSTANQQAVTTNTIRDGAVTATKLQSSANDNAQRAVGTNHIQDKAVSAAKLADDTQAYLSFPLGGIVMWSGTIAQIPGGWYLCDGGTYGGLKTPDLRNKFIVGSGSSYNIGSTGGSADATLVSHSHITISTINLSDTNPKSLTGTFPNEVHNVNPTGVFSQTNTSHRENSSAGNNGRSISMNAEHRHETDTQGSSGTNANLPPYYALAYIMKCEFRAGSVATITTTVPTLQELRLNGPLYDQEMDGGAQKGNAGDVLTSLGAGNGVRWSSFNNGAVAWANFSGVNKAVGSDVKISSYNISSIVKTAPGGYTVYFAKSLPSANYAISGTVSFLYQWQTLTVVPGSLTRNSFQIYTSGYSTNSNGQMSFSGTVDLEYSSIIVYSL
jgi:hypothetical protein